MPVPKMPCPPLVHAEGVTEHALSTPFGNYAIYLDGRGPSNLTLLLPAGTYKTEWLNPQTGSLTIGKKFSSDGKEMTISTPAFENGIALRLGRVNGP